MKTHELKLGLNIDHCATIRQARYRDYSTDCGGIVEPDPVALALVGERAGADGITVHLREDRRHIQASDVRRLRECILTRLNLEMACTDEMVAFALDLKPDIVCLVPENRTEVTTEGGLNVAGQMSRVGNVVSALTDAGIETSLFIDPDEKQLTAAAKVRSPFVELHTGCFANRWHNSTGRREELEKLKRASITGHDLGLIINAGHGINYINIRDIVEVPWLYELNIGHSILSRAVFTGIEEAVRVMKERMIKR